MSNLSTRVQCGVAGMVVVCSPACSSLAPRADSSRPEAVVAVYRVKPGAETQLEDALRRAWDTYRRERMVCNEPHLCVRVQDDARHTSYFEVFEWVGYFAAEHPPKS